MRKLSIFLLVFFGLLFTFQLCTAQETNADCNSLADQDCSAPEINIVCNPLVDEDCTTDILLPPSLITFDKSLEYHGIGAPTLITFDTALEYHGIGGATLITFDTALEYHGNGGPTLITFDQPLEYHGRPDNDTSLLEAYLLEVITRHEEFDQWYTTNTMAKALVSSDKAPEGAAAPDFQLWLPNYLNSTIYNYASGSNIKGYMGNHSHALKMAIDAVEKQNDRQKIRVIETYFTTGMSEWRKIHKTIDVMYYDCLLGKMLQTKKLRQDYTKARQFGATRKQKNAGYDAYYAVWKDALACTDKTALKTITDHPAFTWPMQKKRVSILGD